MKPVNEEQGLAIATLLKNIEDCRMQQRRYIRKRPPFFGADPFVAWQATELKYVAELQAMGVPLVYYPVNEVRK